MVRLIGFISCSICCSDIGGAVGTAVGIAVGTAVGTAVGIGGGSTLGTAVGTMAGTELGTVVGTAVGAMVGCMIDGDGSDVDDVKVVRCHGPCGRAGGCLAVSSSSSMSTGCCFGGSVKMLLMLGDGTWTVVKFFLMARRWPLTVASERGGYFRNCAEVMDGKVVK